MTFYGQKMQKSSTIDQSEIQHFTKDSAKWWDENGPFKPLHRLNPVRMRYIKERICTHFDRDFNNLKALEGINVLDIGCGGGLACESLARMGASVTGLDADANAIEVAKKHAELSELTISYENKDAGTLDTQYDVVLALEVVEHVSDVSAFIKICSDRLKPGGVLIMSTLNRTAKSYALGIVAAEYILQWVPRGTHSWKKFLKPSEVAAHARTCSLTPDNVTGLIFNPVKNKFELLSTDLDVNYLMTLSHKS